MVTVSSTVALPVMDEESSTFNAAVVKETPSLTSTVPAFKVTLLVIVVVPLTFKVLPLLMTASPFNVNSVSAVALALPMVNEPAVDLVPAS